jgi:arylsulfatase A-like enzyme
MTARIVSTLAAVLALAACTERAPPEPVAAERKLGPSVRPNVLFVIADDLRTEIGPYGSPHVSTPHLDALAAGGIVFERAYVQQAVCNPSRASFMTGRRPSATEVTANRSHFRLALPDAVTLPQYFKQQGWHALGIGKIYHTGFDDPDSWSEPHWMPPAGRYSPATTVREREFRAALAARGEGFVETAIPHPSGRFTARIESTGTNRRFLVTEAPEVDDAELQDGQTARRAVELLRRFAREGRPFFLAVGFGKPHAPFVAPKPYWDRYDADALPLTPVPARPEGAPRYAFIDSPEIRGYDDVPDQGPIPLELARRMIHGYYAATSFMDAQLGLILAELDATGLAEQTLIVFVGDHGYKLGDYGYWGKQSNVEFDTRSPLILRLPGRRHAGVRVTNPVEFIDIYPTLVELAELPARAELDGISLVGTLTQPQLVRASGALSQYPRDGNRLMGWSLRTARYRYTEWVVIADGSIEARELYDHADDRHETRNRAADPAFAPVLAELAAQLQGRRAPVQVMP